MSLYRLPFAVPDGPLVEPPREPGPGHLDWVLVLSALVVTALLVWVARW